MRKYFALIIFEWSLELDWSPTVVNWIDLTVNKGRDTLQIFIPAAF